MINNAVELNNEWFCFIEKFVAQQFHLKKKKNRRGLIFFKLKNYLETGIEIRNKNGFLDLFFKDQSTKESFLAFVEMEQSITPETDRIRLRSTNWNRDKYPCRVFINKKKINFYDESGNENYSELFNYRMTTFQNTMFAILKYKINCALKQT